MSLQVPENPRDESLVPSHKSSVVDNKKVQRVNPSFKEGDKVSKHVLCADRRWREYTLIVSSRRYDEAEKMWMYRLTWPNFKDAYFEAPHIKTDGSHSVTEEFPEKGLELEG